MPAANHSPYWRTKMTASAQTPARHLLVADRCDKCGAQAFVIAKFAAGELLFCGHHFSDHELMIRESSFEVIDEREFINQKGGSSA
jgi:hypothetical protein